MSVPEACWFSFDQDGPPPDNWHVYLRSGREEEACSLTQMCTYTLAPKDFHWKYWSPSYLQIRQLVSEANDRVKPATPDCQFTGRSV